MSQAVSYPVATGVTIRRGDAVSVTAGELVLAGDTSLCIGAATSDATEGVFVAVQTSGEIYMFADGDIAAGARVQASDEDDGSVRSATSLAGRMVGIAAAAAVGGVVLVSVGPFDINADT